MAGIYAVFALGLNVHWGFTGLFNIGIAGFFAVGAYTSALLTTRPPDPLLFEEFVFGGNWAQLGFLDLGIDLWFFLALAAAGAVCGVIALIIGYVTLRLHDDYLAIATLGIAESVRLLFLNEKWIANGSKGLYQIPQFLEGWISPDKYSYLYMVVVLAVLAVLLCHGAAGDEISLGPGAAGHPRRRDRGRGQRQERLRLQAASVCLWAPSSWALAGRCLPTTSGSSRR